MNPILMLDRMLRDAAAKSAKLAEARANLPAGSSRARVTTANARWARAAKAREGLATRLREAVEALHDPAEIAEVLAGVLRGRGVRATSRVEAFCPRRLLGPFVVVDWSHETPVEQRWRSFNDGAPSARAAIVRIAATTTAEDALKALEGT